MRTIFLIVCAGMLGLAGCVAPDQYELLENRIAALEMENSRQKNLAAEISGKGSKLETDLVSIQDKIQQDDKTSRENYAELRYEINHMKEQFQQLEGLIEELKHHLGSNSQVRQEELEKQMERMDNAISRNYEKVINLEKYMGFEPTVAKTPEEGGETTTAAPQITSEQELYDFAKKLFDDGDMENARIQFENFINKYPDSDNADNARFWIADSYYAEKWYEKAILEYQAVLETYPNSNKIAAARLKQGYSFAELGEKANARLILKELVKRHPGSKEANYAKEKLKSLN